MSWLFSRALVEASLAEGYLDGEPFVPSSGTPTPPAFLWRGKTTATWKPSRFGMTCSPLTDDLGRALLMWSLAASPAPTFQRLAEVPESRVKRQACGSTWLGWWAKFDPNGSSWRTAQSSLLGDLELYLETWPSSGLMLRGKCYPRTPWAPTMSESASGLWPTPRANDAEKRGNFDVTNARNGLAAAVRLFPTPCARDYRGIGKSRMERTGSKAGENLPQFLGGLLNPNWEEWLMGWVVGWTACEPLATAKFQEWRQQHSPRSQQNLTDKAAA